MSQIQLAGDGRVARVFRPRHPPIAAPHEVVAEDDPRPVVLEALRRVYTTDLCGAARIGGPEVRLGYSRNPLFVLGVPGAAPWSYPNIVNKPLAAVAIPDRIRPWSAETGRHPGSPAPVPGPVSHPILKCRRRFGTGHLERVVIPGHGET